MNKVISTCLVAFLIATVAMSAWATEVSFTANVLRVHPLADGSVVLMMTSESASCTSTATPYKYYNVKIGQGGVTADGLRAIHTTAMTAFSTGLRLQVYFDDATTSCYVTRVLMKE